MSPTPQEKPGIIGRERALMDKLAKLLHEGVAWRYEVTDVREDRRGSHFEVRVIGPDGEATGHIARITIELDRVEDPNNWSS